MNAPGSTPGALTTQHGNKDELETDPETGEPLRMARKPSLWNGVRRAIRLIIFTPLALFIALPIALLVGGIYAIFDIAYRLTGVEAIKTPVKPLWRVWWNLWNWIHDNFANLLVGSPNRRFSWTPWGGR